jgi:hypothetical protein
MVDAGMFLEIETEDDGSWRDGGLAELPTMCIELTRLVGK